MEVHADLPFAEPYALPSEPPDLLPTLSSGQGDAPAGTDDTMPGESFPGPQSEDRQPRRPREPRERGDLAVRRDFAPRDLGDHPAELSEHGHAVHLWDGSLWAI